MSNFKNCNNYWFVQCNKWPVSCPNNKWLEISLISNSLIIIILWFMHVHACESKWSWVNGIIISNLLAAWPQWPVPVLCIHIRLACNHQVWLHVHSSMCTKSVQCMHMTTLYYSLKHKLYKNTIHQSFIQWQHCIIH